MAERLTNWAGNIEFSAPRLHRPASAGELRKTVADHARVRALGSGHSFSPVADTTGALVSLDRMPRAVDVDTTRRTARVSAGTTFAGLAAELRRHGLALRNLPSSPHFTVAGAYATGTHGSGDARPSLAAEVRSLDLVTADGAEVSFRRGDAEFGGAVTALGALGIVTSLTVDVCPAYEVEQYVYEELPPGVLTGRFDEVFAAARSVSVFTRWAGPLRVWAKRGTDEPFQGLGWAGARAATHAHHPIEGMPTQNATEQLGVPGPWDERLPHFRAGFVPSRGEELQSEYLVPRAHAAEAIRALAALEPWISPVLLVSEIRTVAADTCWLSPSHGRDSAAFHFTWAPEGAAVASVLRRVEEALAPYGARPHWGKLFRTAPGDLARSYARWEDFAALLHRYDPAGKFRNALLDRLFPDVPEVPGAPGAPAPAPGTS